MQRRTLVKIAALATFLLAGVAVLFALGGGEVPGDTFDQPGRAPVLRPVFSGITLPPNIAPMNFLVEEEGTRFFARMYSKEGGPLEVSSSDARIILDSKPWRRLLEANRGEELHLDVYVKNLRGRWNRFETLTNRIAAEEIDGHVAYRKMFPARGSWTMSINSRELSSFDESAVLQSTSFCEVACMNCHTPLKNNPDKMLLGVRSSQSGNCTLQVEEGVTRKIDAKFGYTAWHPSGKLAVYSVNQLPLFMHTGRKVIRDTIDLDSYLAYYLPDRQVIKTCPQLSKKRRLETWPTWSPDGKHLYFCSAQKLWEDTDKFPPKRHLEVRYDLERISYDLENDRWGKVETVLSSERTGKSIAMPKISPDGRWLSFCMFDHGFFPNWQEESDLYIVDLEAEKENGAYAYRRLELNSDKSESWHQWSLNSRWIVFSSKRDHGIFTRLYFSYIDEAGRAHKPFILPQEDPAFYDSCLKAFNTAAFVTGPVPSLGSVRSGWDRIQVDAVTMPTRKVRKAPQTYFKYE